MGPPIAAKLISAWCNTCCGEICIQDQSVTDYYLKFGGGVGCTWHQRMFYFFRFFGVQHVTMMISQSKDGEYANAVATRLGFRSVRGSSRRDGSQAMYELIEQLRGDGYAAGMMADGPTGPPRVLKMGTVKIARETGKPIYPMMYGAKNKIVLNTWDRYVIPYPFSRVVLLYGIPVFVPPDASNEDCERIRLCVEKQMNEMADFCDTYWGGKPVGKPGYDLPPAIDRSARQMKNYGAKWQKKRTITR